MEDFRMRIGLDGSIFTEKDRRGIEYARFQIIKYWMDNYTDHEYYILTINNITLGVDLPGNWHIISLENKLHIGNFTYKFFVYARFIKKLNLDLYWSTFFFLPAPVLGVAYFVSVDDLSLIVEPKWNTWKMAMKMNVFCRLSCAYAKAVITNSNSAANDIHKYFKIDNNKIFMSYHGGFSEDNIISNYDIGKVRTELRQLNYFVFIGGFEPRKNIPTIIRAFERYMDNYGQGEKLILAGKKYPKSDEVFSLAAKSRYRDNIIIPGYINSDEKSYLLSHAICLLFPSLYEGFGFPILEAFKFKLPVITSNISSMPEVGGDAAYYINDPSSIIELANKMNVVRNIPSEDREVLNEKMFKQLSKFSWDKSANEIMAFFMRNVRN